ncbi:DNA-directed RNA polymerase subunit A' [Candidatus Woesearchaeota archaeon]|nr:DNA-directed RNA polymerase subunit A' [Candidatus Woesearchaeota archaeon]
MNEQIPVHKIVNSISFGLISPKLVKKLSNVKIVTPELYDREGYPVDGGLMDIRLGVIDPGLKCKTCGSKIKECLGHFGYIELARPVVHVNFVKVILDILRGTCRGCGKLLSESEDLAIDFDEDVDFQEARKETKGKISDLRKITKCPHCKAKQYKVALDKPTNFVENEKRISPIEVRMRLEKISDEDVSAFGINAAVARPEWMILTLLLIPPVTIRPSITLQSGERSEDDLTHKLGDIVRINQRLFENINAGAPEIIIEDLWDLLQYHITTFFDNALPQIPPARHRSGQPLKTLSERIKSKEGRIRHNLAGKRTNFSARTVISPDSMLDLNEVGIPKEVAMKLTIPERVTEWNKDYLKEFVKKGPKAYPGSNYVIRPDGRKKKITSETQEQILEELQPGYLVERHLMDGDISIFNRQPSLHRMSMMAHKIKVLPGMTFRLSPAVCAPYNADFDGDEMNLHIPQTEEARAEAEILMMVQTQVISPRYGLSIIGCNMDAISGNYILTRYEEYSRKDAVQLLTEVGHRDFSRIPKKDVISGKEVFSMLLPNDFDFEGKTRTGSPVIIKKGILKEGYMDKSNLGEGQGLMLRNLHKKYGSDKNIEILGKIFRLGIKVLLRHGLTAPIGNTDLPKDVRGEVDLTLSKAQEESYQLISDYHKGVLDAFPGRSVEETLELKILELLNKSRNDVGNLVMKHADKHQHLPIMVDSGAKGSSISMTQMVACVGQQALRGKRIERGYKNRTLSSFKPGDLGPQARGFVENSFKSGLKPHEFFYMAMTGRDSLMDTALRTPKSGYLYRRLANALQDLKVEYDQTVRDASNNVVQFLYGGDGIDVSKSENGYIDVKKVVERETGGKK